MWQPYAIPQEFAGTNLCYPFSYAKGDVEQGFKSADDIFEDTFSFPRVQHFSMEPHATVAHVEQDRMTLWAATQEPFTLRDHLADIFRLPLNKIRIIVPYLGGAYGGKLAVKTEPLTAALSWKAKRPVRLAHSIEESFKTVTRHPARVLIKTGVTKNGKIVARQCLIHMETGAYADAGPRVTQKAGYRCFGPYCIPHMKTDAYTCTPIQCPQAHTAASAHCKSPGLTNPRWISSRKSWGSTRSNFALRICSKRENFIPPATRRWIVISRKAYCALRKKSAGEKEATKPTAVKGWPAA